MRNHSVELLLFLLDSHGVLSTAAFEKAYRKSAIIVLSSLFVGCNHHVDCLVFLAKSFDAVQHL
jgi:hypothetical protein